MNKKRLKVKKIIGYLSVCMVIYITGTYVCIAQKSSDIRVLIVDGFSNHDWRQTTAVTKWILENSQLFKVEVITVPADSLARESWLPNFKDFQVVIQNTNNIHNRNLKWPRRAEEELENFVSNGGGLYVLHSANNAFSHWSAYDEMIGLGWRPNTSGKAIEIDSDGNIIEYMPGQGKDTGHNERFNAVIQVLNRHPINEGYPDAWQTVNTEVYYYPRGPAKNLQVLSYAYDSTGTQKYWPVEWVVNYGKGKVYNSSLGHLWEGEIFPESYRCIGYQTTVIRATEWLAVGRATYPLPKNFPTKNNPSLMSFDSFPVNNNKSQ